MDYSPKQAAHYLHNLTTILTDKGSVASLGQVSYSISDQPDTVHDLLLQKSNGTFYLVVWGERFAGGSDNITVNLEKTYGTVRLYDPTRGVTATQTLTNPRLIALTLSNHPVVIEMVG